MLVTVLCQPVDRNRFEQILFEESGTLGIRYREQQRTSVRRSITRVVTQYGAIRGKLSYLPSGSIDFSPEYDDCKSLAEKFGERLSVIVESAKSAYANGHVEVLEQSSQPASAESHTHSHDHGYSHSHDHGHSHSHDHTHLPSRFGAPSADAE